MPFDLFVRPLSGGDRVPALALERAPLPQDSVVKTIHTPGYRDRYAIVSGAELLAMCDGRADDELKDRLARVSGGSIVNCPAFLLHWEEWESGR